MKLKKQFSFQVDLMLWHPNLRSMQVNWTPSWKKKTKVKP